MQKKLSRVGHSLGLIIDKPILELLRIDQDTLLDISTDGEALIIRPVTAAEHAHRSRVRAAAERVADDHCEAFEKLSK
ncbi:AbrB/MazE/SpoVT family DNA-binding domain-containing protein [Lujinxingia vulgaris]|uniref:AbrB/MazE/SpoVT family DNA-binding domain-containing protein n=1 Tax=Lujinxingia vulgaris TaxID=2600176 RepID=A0A5C6XFX0_9DELT|nr:AbrB/MazE/SpoVT family DNA-binding domain-containing protein [Lujinxingia vulgaris]TXD38743.1 AbrB/MazE/SpoVT family DNA-binding domain-containing protein [Lujinxingia vulgaris]